MSTPTELIHAMAERSMKKMRVAAVVPGGILSYMTAAKRIKMEDGGPSIENPLLVGGNPNVGPALYYDKVPVTRSSELDTVQYDMTRIVGTYVISDQEVDENTGASKIVDIAAAKMQALEIAIKQYRRTKAAGTNSGNHPLGLGNLVPTTVTSGTIGGINLALQTLFRPSVYDYSGSPLTSSTIEATVDDILLDMNNDEGKITVIFAGRNMYKLFTAAARDKGTMQLSQTGFGTQLANLGLVGVTFQQIPVIYDEELDADLAYMINENEIMNHILKTANMKMKDLQAPYDQDVIGKRFILETQMCAWKQYRTNAVIKNA